MPEVEHKLAGIPGIDTVRPADSSLNRDGSRMVITASRADDLPEKVYRACVENNWVLTELRENSATLEDVFAELTK